MRHVKRAVVGALLAFAPLASAEMYSVQYWNERMYASDALSSGDVKIDYRGASPEIDFTIWIGKGEADGILEGDTIEVTFTLANAKFGRNVVSGDMLPENFGVHPDSCRVRVTDVEGVRGSNAVTFEVEAADNDCFCTVACNVEFRFGFSLPWLYGVTGPVSATITTDAPDGSGWPELTDETSGDAVFAAQDCEDAANAAGPCTKLEGGVLQRQAAPVNGRRSALAIIDFPSELPFTQVASAEMYSVLYWNERMYASAALSSGDVKIDYRGASPEIDFNIRMIGRGPGRWPILEGDTIEVTFTLANAKFGRNVVSGDMLPENFGVHPDSCRVRVTDVEGVRGSNAVTFEVEAADNDCFCTVACNVEFRFGFSLPWLYGVTGPVSATITTDAPDGSGWPELTDETSGDAVFAAQDCEDAANAAGPCTKLEGGVLQRQAAPVNGRRSALAIIDFRSDLAL